MGKQTDDMMTDEERYRDALEHLATLGGTTSEGNRIAQEALYPKPLTEEVIQKAMICPECEQIYGSDAKTCTTGAPLVDCTIKFIREVPRKVKKRVEWGPVSFTNTKAAQDPYRERPDEIAGKTGRLIFEYEQ